MLLKLRGKDCEFLNSMLEDKNVEIFVGLDCMGKEVYTGDIIIDEANGAEYRVSISTDLFFLPFENNISNFKLKEQVI